MKSKLITLISAVVLCMILACVILYNANRNRILGVNVGAYHILAATGLKLSGINEQGDPYTVGIDSITQLDRTHYDINTATIEYIDHATKTKQKFHLRCKSMIVHYHDNSEQFEQIKKVEFTGGVTITNEDKIGYGDTAEFILKDNVIVLQGNAALKEKHSYIKGEKVIYNVKTAIFKVVGNTKVIVN